MCNNSGRTITTMFCATLLSIYLLPACGTENPIETARNTVKQALSGSCNSSDIRNHIYGTNNRFAENWRSCSKSAWGNTEGTTNCLMKTFSNLSRSCASCFGDYAGCTKSNCFWTCAFNPDGESCQQCSANYCRSKLLTCTGVADGQIPRG